jgi:hypothetical protein
MTQKALYPYPTVTCCETSDLFDFPSSGSERHSLGRILLTYLLTELSLSWGAVNCAASQELPPAFYGTRRFNTVFTRALHWSLSWAILIQSTPSHPMSLRSILILSTHLRLYGESSSVNSCRFIRIGKHTGNEHSEFLLNIVQILSLYLTSATNINQLLLYEELYETHVGRMKSFGMLKQVAYTVTTDPCWNKRNKFLYNTMREPIQSLKLLQRKEQNMWQIRFWLT